MLWLVRSLARAIALTAEMLPGTTAKLQLEGRSRVDGQTGAERNCALQILSCDCRLRGRQLPIAAIA